MGINAKEAENVAFAREVIALLPEFLDRPNVLGIGEIGLHKCTPNEVTTLVELIDLAMRRGEQMLFHTPHLEDKYKGTRMILDLLRADRRVDRSRVCIDHCEEHTIRLVLDEGYWAGITLYPTTKATPERAADMVEIYGPERILVNSSADWGPSDPLAVPEFMSAMRRRGHPESLVRRIVYENPLALMNQSRGFKFTPPDHAIGITSRVAGVLAACRFRKKLPDKVRHLARPAKIGQVQPLGRGVDVLLSAAKRDGGDAAGGHPVGVQAAVGDRPARLGRPAADGRLGGQDRRVVVGQAEGLVIETAVDLAPRRSSPSTLRTCRAACSKRLLDRPNDLGGGRPGRGCGPRPAARPPA